MCQTYDTALVFIFFELANPNHLKFYAILKKVFSSHKFRQFQFLLPCSLIYIKNEDGFFQHHVGLNVTQIHVHIYMRNVI